MEKDENKKYVDRAGDILSDLIRESRKKLPRPEEEAKQFENELKSVGRLSDSFKENSRKLVEWIKKNKKRKE